MKFIVEESLSDFTFWNEAEDNAKMLTNEEIDEIGERLDELYALRGEFITEDQINNLFSYEFPHVCSLIGLSVDPDTEEVIREKGGD